MPIYFLSCVNCSNSDYPAYIYCRDENFCCANFTPPLHEQTL